MKTILHIISSARKEQSFSRQLSSEIINRIKLKHPIKKVIERDLTRDIPPYLTESSILEFYGQQPVTEESSPDKISYAEEIFREVKEADILVIGTPMHNLGISAPLKGWLDQLIRPGITYRYDKNMKRSGVFTDKKVYLAIASGGIYQKSGENNFLELYIKSVFKEYTGMTDITTLKIEGTALNNFEVKLEKILNTAFENAII